MKMKLIALAMLVSCFGSLNAGAASKRLPDSALNPDMVMASMKHDIISDKGLENLIKSAQINFTQKWNEAKSKGNWLNPDYVNTAMHLRVLIQLQECRNQKK